MNGWLAATFFLVYEALKDTLPFAPHLTPVNHMLSASIAEIVRIFHLSLAIVSIAPSRFQAACLIRVPTEVIKTRTQTSIYGVSAQTSLAAVQVVFSKEGWRGFYRGFGPTIMREVRLEPLNHVSQLQVSFQTSPSRFPSLPYNFLSMNF